MAVKMSSDDIPRRVGSIIKQVSKNFIMKLYRLSGEVSSMIIVVVVFIAFS
jgi:predicted Na+-dependent transporter